MKKDMGRSGMTHEAFWVVRTTLDVYLESVWQRRIGANENTLSRLKKFAKADRGVFYISTATLHSGKDRICEFRQPFTVTGSVEPRGIKVPTLPEDKRLRYSLPIDLWQAKNPCHISGLIEQLGFIVKKNSWGSYLMQAFIGISREDFHTITKSLESK